jgi:hypothetical protein
MLCVIDIDCTDREAAAKKVCALLELALDDARLEVRTGKVPHLYKAGVRYVPQSKDACAFVKPSVVMARKGGDCKQLVLWRLAELREAGINATPRILWVENVSGFRAHAILRHPNGRSEDPSLNLGMKAP